MDLFDSSKSIIENAYLLSGPILAVLGFFIFRQIILAKEQLKVARDNLGETQKQLLINSTRDSIKLAAEQIRFYMNDIVTYANESFDKLNQKGLKRVTINTKRFIASDVFASPNLKEILEYLKNSDEVSAIDLKVMNALETFSTYFVQKVADEKVAFQSIGISFCNTVETLSLIFSTCRTNESSQYINTITLYRLWKSRIERQDLESQKETVEKELTAKIENIKSKIKSTPDSKISPLGTE